MACALACTQTRVRGAIMLRLALPSHKALARPLLPFFFRSSYLHGRCSSSAPNVISFKEEKKKIDFNFGNNGHPPEDFSTTAQLVTQYTTTTQEPIIEQLTITENNNNTNNTTETTLEILEIKPQSTEQQTKEKEIYEGLQEEGKVREISLETAQETNTQGDAQRDTQRDTRRGTRRGTQRGARRDTHEVREAQEAQEEDAQASPAERRTIGYYARQMSLALASSINDVFRLCMEMKQAKIKPDVAIINLVISAYARIRCSDMAFVMFDQMLQLRVKPNSYTLESLLTACDVTAEVYRAQEIVKRMRDLDVWPNMVSHSYMISIYVKNREYELAWAEYEAMKAIYNATLPDVLGNFFRLVLASQSTPWIYNILVEMYNNQIEYTRYEIARALDVFLVLKDLKGCLLLQKIEGKDMEEGTLVKILNLAAQLQDKSACALLFDAIRALTGAPSRIAYYAWLSEALYAHDARAFLDRVNDMTIAGHKLGGVYATQFARICATPAQIDQARAHLASAQAAGKFVGVDALSAVMRACARAGDMDRAVKTFTDCLKKYKLVPDIEGFNSIIEASEKSVNVDSAENMIHQMTAHGVQPTVASFEALIRTCIAASDLVRATSALSNMAAFGLQPTYQVYAGLATLCANVGEFKQASAIVNAMIAAGMKPSESLVLGIQPYHKKHTQTDAPAISPT